MSTDCADLPLFRAPAQQHSSTSLAAADAIRPSAASLRGQVLRYLEERGPASDEEMQEGLSLNPSTQRPRRVELVRLGLVVDTGQTRLTRSGRRATLWGVV